jgi:hypothetical protein
MENQFSNQQFFITDLFKFPIFRDSIIQQSYFSKIQKLPNSTFLFDQFCFSNKIIRKSSFEQCLGCAHRMSDSNFIHQFRYFLLFFPLNLFKFYYILKFIWYLTFWCICLVLYEFYSRIPFCINQWLRQLIWVTNFQ